MSGSINARKHSFSILYQIFFKGAMLNKCIDSVFATNTLSDLDKSFIREECAGVIEHVEDIDSIINRYSKKSATKLDKDVLIALRMGVYELLYYSKVPSFATLNETVNLVKTSKNSMKAGFVNAILRNIDRNHLNGSSQEHHAKNDRNLYFRIYNTKDRTVLDELDKKRIIYHKYDGSFNYKYAKVYSCKSYKSIIDTDSFRSGHILISDASSIFMTDKLAEYINQYHEDLIAKEQNGIRLLDTCASPGGKVLGVVDFLDNNNFYAEARDLSDSKIKKINENVGRLKVQNIHTCAMDATKFRAEDVDKFDVVICDVPCSGLGVIGKKPDIKLHYTKERLDSLLPVQRKILDVSSKYLKADGILAYSTCTTNKEENEDNIADFLNGHNDFIKIYEKRIDLNDDNKADGFYFCFMKKM